MTFDDVAHLAATGRCCCSGIAQRPQLIAQRGQGAQLLLDRREFAIEHTPNVRAGFLPRAPQGENVTNLGQGETGGLRCDNEAQRLALVARIQAITGRIARWRCEEP